jgi:hypothetical protein
MFLAFTGSIFVCADSVYILYRRGWYGGDYVACIGNRGTELTTIGVSLFLGGLGFILLDGEQQASSPLQQIEATLQQRFPFIGNHEVISELASLVQSQADTIRASANESSEVLSHVKLSREAVVKALAPVEFVLEESSIEQVVRDLSQ